MPTLLTGLQIGTKSLMTSQTALSTISHNISNVNTEGYVRQRVVTGAEATNGFGDGVSVSDIQRVVDKLLVNRITNQTSEVGFDGAVSRFTQELEVLFGAPNSETSMEQVLNNFFNEMNILSNVPSASSQKLNVVQRAEFVTDTLNTMSTEIQSAQMDIDGRIDDEIVTINTALKKIHELNQEIVNSNIGGVQGAGSNDLQNQREVLINEVAERLSLNVNIDSDGRARLVTDSGRRLVDTTYVQLERIAGSPFADIGTRPVLSDGSLASTVFPILISNMSAGSIKGMVDVRDNFLVDLDAQVDELAATLIRETNLLHSKGTGIPPQNSFLSGNGANISGAGSDLFLPTELGLTGSTSFDISVVDISTGAPVVTTLPAGGGTTSINIPAAGPFSLNDLALLINTNPDIGADVTATVTTDAQGYPAIQIAANNPANAIVMANNTGNPLGEIGMNNFFSGTDAGDIAVRSDIISDPSLVATARMRASDGGVSFNDNQNIIELAQMADREFNFAAAGTLTAQTDSVSGYFITIVSNFAVNLQDNADRLDFSEKILTDMQERFGAISGVNVDEELSNLLIFQNTFQASARIVGVMDELLEVLVTMV